MIEFNAKMLGAKKKKIIQKNTIIKYQVQSGGEILDD